MSKRLLFPFLVVVLIAAACNFGKPEQKSTEPPAPTQIAAPPTEAAVEKPTETAETRPEASTKEGAISNLKEAEKAVVRIVTQGSYEYPDFPASLEESFTGSGFIIDPSGLAVTNNHVVTGAALIEVYFNGDPKPRRAKLLGTSECSDLAIIDIDGDGYPFFEWFDQDIERGLEVYSLGYPLGDPELTQHKGAISKKSATNFTSWADVDDVVEHDAQINNGNSGGPLVTEDGKVVGINYSALKSADQYYAITYKVAKPILEEMEKGKDVLSIGMNGEAFMLEDGFSGIWVYSVASGSPADKLGIKSGDVLLEMEGITLAKEGTLKEFCNILRGKDEGDVIGVKVVRYKAGELLEGQLNGRGLEVTGTYDTGAGTTNNGDNGQTTTSTGDYFTEDFSGDFSAWKTWVVAGNPNKEYASVVNNRLKFEMPNPETYAYVENQNYVYGDVYVEAEVETIRGGENAMSVICRGNPQGWYELRVHTVGSQAGTYEVYRYDEQVKAQKRNPYVNLMKNIERLSTMDIAAGFRINNIGLFCEGSNIHVYINGVEQFLPTKEYITDNTFTEGTVGVGAMSYSKGTVEVDFVRVFTSDQP